MCNLQAIRKLELWAKLTVASALYHIVLTLRMPGFCSCSVRQGSLTLSEHMPPLTGGVHVKIQSDA